MTPLAQAILALEDSRYPADPTAEVLLGPEEWAELVALATAEADTQTQAEVAERGER